MRKLSTRAQHLVMVLAQEEGHKSKSSQIVPEHVVLALLKTADGLGYSILLALHINVLAFQLSLEKFFSAEKIPDKDGAIPSSKRIHALLETAALISRSMNNEYIGTEHILLAAAREVSSVTALYFEKAGITGVALLDMARKIQGQQKSSYVSGNIVFSDSVFKNNVNSFNPGDAVWQTGNTQKSQESSEIEKPKNLFIDEFSRDLTALVQKGKADPIVGREKEIHRLIQILSRRTKNNPVLIGEPGVGKTAIVEGLAQAIAMGNVPRLLLKKRVLSLDMAALIAGTKYRGEFEERMKRVMKDISENKNILLFVDELHIIIGAGGPEGSMDASNILKPALSRGELQIIGATTTNEYRKYIEKDAALERRFQVIRVEEPSDEETITILEGLKDCYEDYHNVTYDDDVIPFVVTAARRYMPERFLPDKAIDILDEAGSAVKIQEELRPVELDELEKNTKELEEEKKALVAEQNFEQAAVVRDKVRNLKEKLETYKNYWQNKNEGDRKRISLKHVSKIISDMTGIPLSLLDKNETGRLLNMETELHKKVIGQNEAVNVVSSAVRRNRAGVSSLKHPVGSFIFLGPTGVGKTQLAKSLAEFLFGTESALIRIDMSDYMEKHNASRLVGAPPGYIGYDEGGVLTEKVRRHPYSVVLLDEIEKAHSDVFNLLLQLLEEGELSDNLGHTVNFRNTVIIMTSNAGAREITTQNRMGFASTKDNVLEYSEIKASAMGELKKLLSPELINRIDDIVVFNALTKTEVNSILDIQLKELETRLIEKNLILKITSSAKKYLVENGYESSMGARPMRRLIEREIEEPLSKLILKNSDYSDSYVVIECHNNKLVIKLKKIENKIGYETKKIVNEPVYGEKK